MAVNSAGSGLPSRRRRLTRPRTSWDGLVNVSTQSSSATSRDDEWTSAPKWRPSSSSGLQPVNRSQVSDRNVNAASEPIDQIMSGEFWTRWR